MIHSLPFTPGPLTSFGPVVRSEWSESHGKRRVRDDRALPPHGPLATIDRRERSHLTHVPRAPPKKGPSERDERRTKGTNDMPFISLTLGPQPMIHSLLSANGCGRCLVSFVSRCALASGHSSPLPSAVSEAVKRR